MRRGLAGLALHVDPADAEAVASFLCERSNAADGSPDAEERRDAASLAGIESRLRALLRKDPP